MTLFNNELTVRPRDGEAQTRLLEDRGELLAALRDRFGITLASPAAEALPFLQRLSSQIDK